MDERQLKEIKEELAKLSNQIWQLHGEFERPLQIIIVIMLALILWRVW
jgi:hypothetical protein